MMTNKAFESIIDSTEPRKVKEFSCFYNDEGSKIIYKNQEPYIEIDDYELWYEIKAPNLTEDLDEAITYLERLGYAERYSKTL